MIVSIHQPNFVPWYPFFQKIQASDCFIILENCQFEKNNFQNRFNIGETWYTMSVKKGLEPIVNKVYVNPHSDWEKIKTKLKNYKSLLDNFDDCISESLSETNKKVIVKICEFLEIKTKIVSDFPTDLKSTERLIHLCKINNATHYLSGLGGKKYLDPNLFEKNNIELLFQEERTIEKKPILLKLSEI